MLKGRPYSKSRKAIALAKKFENRTYREQFVAAHTRRWFAHQIREIRGDMSQAEFGRLLGKPQSVISRLEDPNYGKLSIQTCLEVAAKTDRAFLLQLVSYDEFIDVVTRNDRSDVPHSYDEQDRNVLASAGIKVLDDIAQLAVQDWLGIRAYQSKMPGNTAKYPGLTPTHGRLAAIRIQHAHAWTAERPKPIVPQIPGASQQWAQIIPQLPTQNLQGEEVA